MKHHVIYVPGLGDERSYGQQQLLWFWRLYGLTPHYHAIGWADKEPFKFKLDHLLELIDSLKIGDNKVSLVGASAGASAVLTAYSRRFDDITGVVCISGKIQNGHTIGQKTYDHNPAFKESVAGLPAVLNKLDPNARRRVMSIHPAKDQTVPPADTIIPGATEKQVPVRGHIQSIFYCITISAPSIAKFLKKF
jgi:predicted peptidase